MKASPWIIVCHFQAEHFGNRARNPRRQRSRIGAAEERRR
jgi:hypothetical protein